jgi:hypothetical protein
MVSYIQTSNDVNQYPLCCMSAPFMLQSLLNPNPLPVIIDMTRFVRESLTPKELTKYIFEDQGFNSRDVLCKILDPDSIVSSCSTADIPKYLELYGPGLLSEFTVFGDFCSTEKKHVGVPDRSVCVGDHAMLVIDYHDGLYVVQNWWKNKEIVEMDEVYLKNCSPCISFVKTKQTGVPKHLPVVLRHAMSGNLDKPDCPSMNEFT